MAGDATLNGETCFRGVWRVLPGATIICTKQRRSTRKAPDFNCNQELRLGSIAEYAEAVASGLERAVAARTRSTHPVAISVSGGFDSSSLFCLAHRVAAAGNGTAAIVGVSQIYPGHQPAREEQFLPFLEQATNSNIVRLPALPGFMAVANDLVRIAESPFVRPHGDSELDRFKYCTNAGARTLLDGWFGDQLTYNLGYILDLVRHGKLQAAHQSCEAYADSFGFGAGYHYYRPLLTIARVLATPHALRRPLRRLRYHGARKLQPGWYTDRFATIATERARSQQSARIPEGSFCSRNLYRMARNAYYASTAEATAKLGAAMGMHFSSPFYDAELIQLVMSIPGEVLHTGGRPRGLFREAMKGTLPEPIRTRGWKAHFGTFLAESAIRDLAEIENIMTRESLAIEYGYVDAARVRNEIATLRARVLAGDNSTLLQLHGLVGLEIWLRSFMSGNLPVMRPHYSATCAVE